MEDGTGVLLAALRLPQLGPPDPDFVRGESARGCPDLEHRIVSDLTRVQVGEVSAMGTPVKRPVAVLAGDEGDLLPLEGGIAAHAACGTATDTVSTPSDLAKHVMSLFKFLRFGSGRVKVGSLTAYVAGACCW